MFDFTPVGLVLTAVGCVFLILFYWILPQRTREGAEMHEALDIKNYMVEAQVTQGSAIVDKTVADLIKIAGSDTAIRSIIRANNLRIAALPDAVLKVGDILLIEGDHEALDRVVGSGQAQPERRSKGRRRRRRREHRDRGGDRREFQPDRMVGRKPAPVRSFQRQPARGQPQERTFRPETRQDHAEARRHTSSCRAMRRLCRSSCATSACCRWRSVRCFSAAFGAASFRF